MPIRFNQLALAAAALGLAIAGSAFATSSAEASPRHGGHGGGWGHHGHGGHGGGWGHRPHGGGFGCRPIQLCNPGRPGGGYGGGWGGTVVVGNSYTFGARCRLVERENRWGEIVVRRVCRPAHWR